MNLNGFFKMLFCQFFNGRFKWTNLMDEDEKTITTEVDEEMASMMFAAGLWHMEHAHWVSVYLMLD